MRSIILTTLITLFFALPLQSELVIQLTEGENLVSINVFPPEEMYREDEDRGPDFALMFEQIVDHVEIIRDEYGNFYMPSWDNYNSIGYWNLTKCYLVVVDEDVEFIMDGEPIPADTDIPLSEGWNYIAYFPNYWLDASAPDFYVLSPIIEFVESAQDGFGGEMNPGENFSNMEPWRPGRGYIVSANEDVVLNYPHNPNDLPPSQFALLEPTDGDTLESQQVTFSWEESEDPDQDQDVVYTWWIYNGDDSLSIEDIEATELSLDLDTLGIVIEPNRSAEWWVIAQSGDLETECNERFEFLLAGNSVEKTASESLIDFYLFPAFPNPFNATTTIRYNLNSPDMVSIQIFDQSGKYIKTIFSGQQNTGQNFVVWDANGLPSGNYIFVLKSGNQMQASRGLLVR